MTFFTWNKTSKHETTLIGSKFKKLRMFNLNLYFWNQNINCCPRVLRSLSWCSETVNAFIVKLAIIAPSSSQLYQVLVQESDKWPSGHCYHSAYKYNSSKVFLHDVAAFCSLKHINAWNRKVETHIFSIWYLNLEIWLKKCKHNYWAL